MTLAPWLSSSWNGPIAAPAPSSPRPDTSGDEALARRFAAARDARPKAPATKPAAKPKKKKPPAPASVPLAQQSSDEDDFDEKFPQRAPAPPAAPPPKKKKKKAPPDTSGDEELARRLGAAAQRPKPKARKRRTVVESEDDSEDDEAPPAPPPASPPSDEGDDLYDDENDEDEDEAGEPPAPPAGGPRFKGGVSSATSEALHRHVAEALEAAAEAPAPEPEPARPGRIAKKARKASAEAPTGDFMAAYRRVREAYGRNWSHVSEAERMRLALLCRDGKVADQLTGIDRSFTSEGVAYELGERGLLDFEEGTSYDPRAAGAGAAARGPRDWRAAPEDDDASDDSGGDEDSS